MSLLVSCADSGPESVKSDRGVTYYHERIRSGPWSVHVVKMDRRESSLELHSVLARGTAIGLSPLSKQAASVPAGWGKPLAAVNGDFYARGGTPYAGDPRGLQIRNGELISGPGEQAAFWMDANGEPHATNVISRFQITWPGGQGLGFGLNEELRPARLVLSTPALGAATRERANGLELVLERNPGSPWLPLRIGESYQARIRSVKKGGGTRLEPDVMVLSVDELLLSTLPPSETGTILAISTETIPAMKGARTAIGGGSVVTRHGRAVRIEKSRHAAAATLTGSGQAPYAFNSMFERHPRAMMGWNETHFVLCAVDGRQRDFSVGMTLEELGRYMARIGCDVAMSLDGGGSATFWYGGHVVSSPCDGEERPVANGLVVVRKNVGSATTLVQRASIKNDLPAMGARAKNSD